MTIIGYIALAMWVLIAFSAGAALYAGAAIEILRCLGAAMALALLVGFITVVGGK
jgi:hypothetical protein